MGIPLRQVVSVGAYVMRQHLAGRKHGPVWLPVNYMLIQSIEKFPVAGSGSALGVVAWMQRYLGFGRGEAVEGWSVKRADWISF